MELIRSADQLRGKRVLIMGLGTKDGGVGAARYAAQHGARVTVTDLQPPDALAASLRELGDLDVELRLGRHVEEDFRRAEIVIRNPGIRRSHPLLRVAADCGGVVDSPIGIFSEVTPTPYVGITGTKGKSLTTHLVQHMLSRAGIDAAAAGNNCVSPLRHLDPRQIPVLELSSWQLRELGLHRRSPHIGCWTNFFPDHLDHYRDLEEYRDDKAAITRFQGPTDHMVLPWADASLREIDTLARRRHFSRDGAACPDLRRGCVCLGGQIQLRDDDRVTGVLPLSELSAALSVPHHLELVLAAACCADAAGASAAAIGDALRDFPGLPHRFERFLPAGELDFINDSAATTPESTALALRAVARAPLVLIFGGGGLKSLRFDALARTIARRAQGLILFSDDRASSQLGPLLSADVAREAVIVGSMDEAVSAGIDLITAAGRGTLLLSPGCCGSPYFPDLFVRGELFKQSVTRQVDRLRGGVRA